jgi:endothelin-converting enzyme
MKYGLTGQFLRNSWTTSISHSIEYFKATGGNTKNDLSAITGQFIANGLTALVKFSVYDDSKPTLPLHVLPTHLGLPAQSYRDKKTEDYEKLIGEMFYILYEKDDPLIKKPGTPQHVAPQELVVPPQWKDVAKKVVAFETEFAKHIPSDADNENDDFRLQMEDKWLTIDKMNALTPSLDWNVILKNALPDGVNPPEDIAAIYTEYLQELDKLLKATDPKTTQLFFAWSMIRQYAGFLDVAHRRTIGNIRQKSNEVQDDRNLTCARNTLQIVPDIVSHFFVKAALPEPAFAKVKEIIDSIINTYSKSFQPNQPTKPYDWLKDDTRKGALEKLTKLHHIIGYSYSGPDNRNPSSIDEFYNGLKFDGHDNFGNQVHLKTFRAQQKLRKLHKDSKKDKELDPLHMDWTATENNAGNLKETNTLQYPAGRLHSPMFNADFPEYLNYGTSGTTAAHEVTHSFDIVGINYDGNGHESNVSANVQRFG